MVVKVEAYHDGSFWCACGIREEFFTQELVKNVREAAPLHFENALQRGENLNILLMSETEVKGAKAAAGHFGGRDFKLLPSPGRAPEA